MLFQFKIKADSIEQAINILQNFDLDIKHMLKDDTAKSLPELEIICLDHNSCEEFTNHTIQNL